MSVTELKNTGLNVKLMKQPTQSCSLEQNMATAKIVSLNKINILREKILTLEKKPWRLTLRYLVAILLHIMTKQQTSI